MMVMVVGVSGKKKLSQLFEESSLPVDMVVFLCMFVFVFLRVIVLRETVKTKIL